MMMEKYSSCRSADTPYSSMEVLKQQISLNVLSWEEFRFKEIHFIVKQ